MSDVFVLMAIILAVIIIPIVGWMVFVKIMQRRIAQARRRHLRKIYFGDLEDTFIEYQQCLGEDVLPRLTLSSALLYMLGLVSLHFPAKNHELVRGYADSFRAALEDIEKSESNETPLNLVKLDQAFAMFKESAAPYLR